MYASLARDLVAGKALLPVDAKVSPVMGYYVLDPHIFMGPWTLYEYPAASEAVFIYSDDITITYTICDDGRLKMSWQRHGATVTHTLETKATTMLEMAKFLLTPGFVRETETSIGRWCAFGSEKLKSNPTLNPKWKQFFDMMRPHMEAFQHVFERPGEELVRLNKSCKPDAMPSALMAVLNHMALRG